MFKVHATPFAILYLYIQSTDRGTIMPDLIRHHTVEGYRHGVVTHRGRKWMKVHYVAAARPTRMKLEEERHMQTVCTLNTTQCRRFNKSVVVHGGKRGAI